jgi:hypothetical protein
MVHCLPGQNGIRIWNNHFWPTNDGEKWSGKKFILIFEIPPCEKPVSCFWPTDFLGKNYKFSNKNHLLPARRLGRKNINRPLLGQRW